jgi:hypothetical protein
MNRTACGTEGVGSRQAVGATPRPCTEVAAAMAKDLGAADVLTDNAGAGPFEAEHSS